MSRVITFSTKFPIYHNRAGQPTNFVEKILSGEKIHTIRAGKRWKEADKFSPRFWSDRPYNSKQMIIADDFEIVKVHPIIKAGTSFLIANNDDGLDIVTDSLLKRMCANDGLSLDDFHEWFKKAGHDDRWLGQIICWKDPKY